MTTAVILHVSKLYIRIHTYIKQIISRIPKKIISHLKKGYLSCSTLSPKTCQMVASTFSIINLDQI